MEVYINFKSKKEEKSWCALSNKKKKVKLGRVKEKEIKSFI